MRIITIVIAVRNIISNIIIIIISLIKATRDWNDI